MSATIGEFATMQQFASRFEGLTVNGIRRLCQRGLLNLPRSPHGFRVVPLDRFAEVESICRQYELIRSPERIAAGKKPGCVRNPRTLATA